MAPYVITPCFVLRKASLEIKISAECFESGIFIIKLNKEGGT
tara:strand:+ start:418 stop:543 length:126 start_codon:yes stop_codon:yes gene_type:complete